MKSDSKSLLNDLYSIIDEFKKSKPEVENIYIDGAKRLLEYSLPRLKRDGYLIENEMVKKRICAASLFAIRQGARDGSYELGLSKQFYLSEKNYGIRDLSEYFSQGKNSIITISDDIKSYVSKLPGGKITRKWIYDKPETQKSAARSA